MKTLYNIDLGVANRNSDCPRDLFEKTKKILEKNELLGIKRATQIGELKRGYDRSCKVFRKAFFNIHYNINETRTTLEILNKLEKIAKEDYYNSLKDMTQTLKGMLEFAYVEDPSSTILPFNICSEFPVIRSMEIATPCGRQRTLYLTKDNTNQGVLQLWKPEKEKNWYDYLIFKNFLKKSLKDKNMRNIHQEISRLHKKFTTSIDSIKEIPSTIKKLS